MSANDDQAGIGDLEVRVDGARPVSADMVKALEAVCAKAEDHGGPGIVPVHVSGTPDGAWTRELSLPVVTKWERVLRRLERLPMTTVAVASGDCGGPALDALLATDVRIARPGTRLVVPVGEGDTWPGMALFRLVNQAGAARVRQAVLFGVPIGAEEALELRLLDELTDDPASALAAVAERFGAFSGKELAIRRQLMFDATTTAFEDALGAHLAASDRALRGAAAAIAAGTPVPGTIEIGTAGIGTAGIGVGTSGAVETGTVAAGTAGAGAVTGPATTSASTTGAGPFTTGTTTTGAPTTGPDVTGMGA
ncbi:hypothetical protein GCM10023085_56080 [Actinomadura viridis]|uniref:Isomerase DpgB n=1 Tax=Actinomadura viridis TaxID=58110 RepID=A0A931GPK9_9ACTN|nr:enoyl-CoA-hydratase DpgB [Actinomadura viridis]MBG6094010.1 isomerase DpgB [Actinomadura viridis]